MIDSLWLHVPLEEVKIQKNADLGIVPVPENLKSGEVRRKDGGQVGFEVRRERESGGELVEEARFVNGLYANTEYYSFDVSTKGAVVKIYSLPRLVKQSAEAIDPVSPQETEQALDRLRGELAERGVEFPKVSRVVRADLFKNCSVKLPPASYSNMLRGVGGQRTVQKTYGDSVLFGNKQRQASFYNKVEQLSDIHGVDISERGNLLRAEFRALRRATVSRDLSISTTQDLPSAWKRFPSLYSARMKELVFSRQDYASELADLYTKLSFYREHLGTDRWLHRSVYLLGLERFASLTKQERRDLLVPLAGRVAYHRIEKAIKEAGVFSVESERALYHELYSLVA